MTVDTLLAIRSFVRSKPELFGATDFKDLRSVVEWAHEQARMKEKSPALSALQDYIGFILNLDDLESRGLIEVINDDAKGEIIVEYKGKRRQPRSNAGSRLESPSGIARTSGSQQLQAAHLPSNANTKHPRQLP
jgi:hypothetical protein